MKSLLNYINEAVEFEIIKSKYYDYGVVTLVRRENVDCANLSKEEFVKFMKDDIAEAVSEYVKIYNKISEERKKNYIEKKTAEAIKYAEQRYKNDKWRQKYIDNARKNAEAYKINYENPSDIHFDFQPDKSDIGISSVCILGADSTDAQLEKCYDILQKDKFFKKGTGWAFKYQSSVKDKINTYAFRPYIDLLLDESDKEEQSRDSEKLANAIDNFYKDSNYWGD